MSGSITHAKVSALPDDPDAIAGEVVMSDWNAEHVINLTTADVPDSTDKRYVTDAQRTVIGNTSGSNTGDETLATIKSKLGITTLSGSNTGDQDLSSYATTAAVAAGYQPLDSDLTAFAGLSIAADKLPYGTGSHTLGLADFTAAGRALVDDADAAAQRTTLGLGTLATQSGTFSGTSSGTNTGDQTSVSGNAGTATALQTARTIDGQSFDGTANITVIAPGTHSATSKATPVDADEIPLVDSAASNALKKLTWANLKATAKTYFDTLYQAAGSRQRIVSDVTNSTTTFSNLTGLGFTAASSGKYTGRLVLRCDENSDEGIKFDFNGGTATATSFWAVAQQIAGTGLSDVVIATALNGAMNFTSIGIADAFIEINFSLVVDAGGTVIPRFAQDSHVIGTVTVAAGSFMWTELMPS